MANKLAKKKTCEKARQQVPHPNALPW